MNSPFDNSSTWIWLPKTEIGQPNTYAQFRRQFDLKSPAADSKLYISADSDYAVWINGVFVDFNQYDDYPDSKIYDVLPIGSFLKSGKNVICVSAYYQGEGSFQYIPGDPGLLFRLESDEQVISGDADTMCKLSPAYVSGPTTKVTMQLGFSLVYAAKGDDDSWLQPEYMMGQDWSNAEANATILERKVDGPRPIAKLAMKDRVETQVVAQGLFMRDSGEQEVVAQMMHTDQLSTRLAKDMFGDKCTLSLPSHSGLQLNLESVAQRDGAYLVIDLGQEDAGILEMELDASEGTIVDIAYGEHLEDLRVRSRVHQYNFAHRYMCCDGKQSFTHYFQRLAGRYIQLHISNLSEKFILYYAGLRPTEYPVKRLGSFTSPDSLFNKINEVSVRTLHLCMHEHYEDCPWREQALYSMDSRNQALCGYYSFGEYEFPSASFDLLGKGLTESGYLQLCAPMTYEATIPSFSMAWIMELADHYLYSGDIESARKALPTVQKMLGIYLSSMSDGLLPLPQGKEFWQFYDWAEGLDGTSGDYNDFQDVTQRLDAPFNLFFCLALTSAAEMAEACGSVEDAHAYRAAVESLKKAIHETFWDSNRGCYRTYVGPAASPHYAQLVQSLAILAGVCPTDKQPDLRVLVAGQDSGLVRTTLSHSLFKYEALLQEPQKYGKQVFDEISKDWGSMLYRGATSFWERIDGASAFENAGSLCHGWSGIPVYFYGAYLLGIKPLEPGFKTFKFEPVSGIVQSVSGTVPTPHGPIEVAWESVGGEMRYSLSNPPGTSRVTSDGV